MTRVYVLETLLLIVLATTGCARERELTRSEKYDLPGKKLHVAPFEILGMPNKCINPYAQHIVQLRGDAGVTCGARTRATQFSCELEIINRRSDNKIESLKSRRLDLACDEQRDVLDCGSFWCSCPKPGDEDLDFRLAVCRIYENRFAFMNLAFELLNQKRWQCDAETQRELGAQLEAFWADVEKANAERRSSPLLPETRRALEQEMGVSFREQQQQFLSEYADELAELKRMSSTCADAGALRALEKLAHDSIAP